MTMVNDTELDTRALDALKAIQRPDGLLLPEAVVAAARRRNHPLHSRFEWDDTVAGHLYRVDQARALIRKFKVQIVGGETVVVSTKARTVDPAAPVTRKWVHTKPVFDEDGYELQPAGYREVRAVLVDPERRDELLTKLNREAKAAWSRLCDMAAQADRVSDDDAGSTELRRIYVEEWGEVLGLRMVKPRSRRTAA